MDDKQIDQCCSDDKDMEWCAPGCYCKKIRPMNKILIVAGLLLAITLIMGSMFMAGNRSADKQPMPDVSHSISK